MVHTSCILYMHPLASYVTQYLPLVVVTLKSGYEISIISQGSITDSAYYILFETHLSSNRLHLAHNPGLSLASGYFG